ncbi:period circadian protein homolog 2 [Protopterus annectens]|uniref:period circadian protein homolog 2 n=1 Tax=Protopterus annectens TaxID=7888 RepID=UPI001CF987A7|nr:period circadian protein homolog 2 [Protopterus annectens]
MSNFVEGDCTEERSPLQTGGSIRSPLDSICIEQGQDSLNEDIELKSNDSSANDSSGNDSNGHDCNGNDQGNESSEGSNGSSSTNGKDSAMLLGSSESHKSSVKSQSSSPPGSSNSFSLLGGRSEQDNPSTSGCSSEQSAKAKTQKELIKTLKELKGHFPLEKKTKGKSSTLATLKYALRCVKQVRANEEYYQLLMTNDNHPNSLDISLYTVEEIETITSEFTLKNTDIFAVAVSLITGKIVHISEQAVSILSCKKYVFKNAKFVEFLFPKDVSVFYSFTTPYKLPSWSPCIGAATENIDGMQEKSFFCRISGGRRQDGEICYHPFRMTPYLMNVHDTEKAVDQLCCLLLAERVHSGYEAPRIPPDKRIFTTTHSPNCVFQNVDERAVPLLGYLPQDLIGTPVLMHLHPNDRSNMLAIHKKILQFAGQPFDQAIRFCARNGEYILIDTSWSSFVNPWSRKVSFIIGRHKVRMGPVNEDVFASPEHTEVPILDPDIQEITEQIHRVLLQPVHNGGSSGYGSLGSNGSHEQIISMASSSEITNNVVEDVQNFKPTTFQEICKGVHVVKNQGQQMFIESRARQESQKKCAAENQHKKNRSILTKDSVASLRKGIVMGTSEKAISDELASKQQPTYSYQQISCLDSVFRYLESYSIPSTVKRKYESSNTASSCSDDDKHKVTENTLQVLKEDLLLLSTNTDHAQLDSSGKMTAVVGAPITPLALHSKAESVVSFTSQCSYSSTIVHVGDKKLQPESEIIEDGSGGTDYMDGHLPLSSFVTTTSVNQAKEPYKKMGLTKEVLAVHTQKEEQSFLSKFKELGRFSIFESPCSCCLHERQKGCSGMQGHQQCIHTSETAFRKAGKNRKSKSKRVKQHESSDSTISGNGHLHRPPLLSLNHTAWSPSETSQASNSAVPFPAVVPAYPLPVFSAPGPTPHVSDPYLSGFSDHQNSQDISNSGQHSQFPPSLVTSMVALVLPNYVLSQMNNTVPSQLHNGHSHFPSQHCFAAAAAFPSQSPLPAQPQFMTQSTFTSLTPNPLDSFHYNPPAITENSQVPDIRDAPSCFSPPQSLGPQEHTSPPLFQSRCSSPLQLNLLRLEEMPRSVERQDSRTTVLHLGGSREEKGVPLTSKLVNNNCDPLLVELPGENQNSDDLSTSSDVIDILLQEDFHSGTGSAESGSGGSAITGSSDLGSNGYGMSGSGIGSSQPSNTSKYFGSIDSFESVQSKANMKKKMKQSDTFMKYVLQDPIWLLMANTDEEVMMTYQVPVRDVKTILKEDKEKLKRMQKLQPEFTEEQRKELMEVHPWIKKGALPKAIDVKDCMCSSSNIRGNIPAPYDVEIHDLDIGSIEEPPEDCSLQTLHLTVKE